MWVPAGSILTRHKKLSKLCIQTAASVAESFLTPWRQQLSTDSTDFSSSTQSMENWSLSHVHLDRSGLAASLTAQLSCVLVSLFGRRQHILGGAERRTKTANLPFWRSRGLMKSCQPRSATLSAVPCHCQTGSHSWSVADSLTQNWRCPFFSVYELHVLVNYFRR